MKRSPRCPIVITMLILSLMPAFAQSKISSPQEVTPKAGADAKPTANTDEVLDTRGPVQNAGMNVTVDEEGVQAPGYRWLRQESKTEWSAKWIASNDRPLPESSAVCLRKEITLEQEPRKVTAWITSPNYLLYVNNRIAARGSADAGSDVMIPTPSGRRFYDVRDLTPCFHKGINVLGVELLGMRCLLMELLVEYPDGRKVTYASDESWKGISSPYLKTREAVAEDLPIVGKGAKLLFDAKAEPVGWLCAGYDDSLWPACKLIRAPKEHMVVSELPPLMEARYPYFEIINAQGDVTVPQKPPFTEGNPIIVKGDGEFSVRFKRVMAGRCGIKVKGSKGARIILLSKETSAQKASRVYQLQLRDGIQTFESRDYSALGTVTVVVRNAVTPVEILDVSADFLSQPVEYQGAFSCSDEDLNKLWKSGRWSTQICMATHHLDSPKNQEAIGDYGDYLVADLVNYYSMGSNPWLARQDLRKWAWVMENAHYKTFHTSYIFHWLQSLLNYCYFTGDKELLRELAPNVHAVIGQFSSYLGKNGLISEAPNYMFMDWADVPDDKNPKIRFACHHPPAVIGQGYMTALFYRALGDAILVSEIAGDSAHTSKYEKLRKQVGDAYERELWKAERGMYRDGKPFVTSVSPSQWLPADVQMESFSVQNNALAVLYDLAPASRRGAVIEQMIGSKNWDVTPYFMHFVFDSFDHAGLFGKYGVAKMHEYKVVPESQTVREKGPERGDYSHGWIASPTYQMSSKILGVRPTSPGFDTLQIKPELCGLKWAKGTVPTPHGKVDVSWKAEGAKFTMDVTIPDGATANIFVPAKESGSVTESGKPIAGVEGVKFLRMQDAAAVHAVSSGVYRFQSSLSETVK